LSKSEEARIQKNGEDLIPTKLYGRRTGQKEKGALYGESETPLYLWRKGKNKARWRKKV